MGDGAQRLHALELANDVRVARADLKRRVGAGQISAEDVLLRAPWEAASMSLVELLRSQRGWGRRRSHVFLVPSRIPESKTVASLTDRQRLELAGRLSARRAPGPVQSGSAGRDPR